MLPFLLNWKNRQDSLTWDVEVMESGLYQVELYYTCPPEDVGSTITLSFGKNSLKEQITAGHDPPLEGMKHDRVKRIESYVKDFRPLNMGTIQLNMGRGTMSLKATDIPGEQVMDFRLLMFTRIEK
ncbi:MAG: hypothetical protein U5K69_17715 [Balneolaceae bacterium]|nr:hypothetical protein [Balneolaceae bacterium]